MASNLSSLLLGGIAGIAPPDKKKPAQPSSPSVTPPSTPPAARPAAGPDVSNIQDLFSTFSHLGTATPQPVVTDPFQQRNEQFKQDLEAPIDQQSLQSGWQASKTKAQEILQSLMSGKTMAGIIGGQSTREVPLGESLTPIEKLIHKGASLTNPKLKEAFHDAVELYARATATGVGQKGFLTAQDKADAIRRSSELATKIANARNDSNLVDFGIEHDQIKRELHRGRQGWREATTDYTETPEAGARQTREQNAENKRRAVGTLAKSFFDREYGNVSSIAQDPKRTGAAAHKLLMEIQGYVGKNPSEITLDEFMNSPVGRSLVESLNDKLDSIGAWDTDQGKEFLRRIGIHSTDTKELTDRVTRGRDTLAGIGAPQEGEDPAVTTRRDQYGTALRNAQSDLDERNRGLTDNDTRNFGGLFNVGQYVQSALRPSGIPLKSETRGSAAERGQYTKDTNAYARAMQNFVEAIRQSGGDVNAETVKKAAEEMGIHASPKFLATFLGGTSKTPVSYAGEYGQHTFEPSVTGEGQLSQAEIDQTQGQSNNRVKGYGSFGNRPTFTGTLLAGLNLSDADLNALASEAGFKLPQQIQQFKDAARMSAAGANVQGALMRLGELTKVIDVDENGNTVPVATSRKNTATLGGVVMSSVTRLFDKLSDIQNQTFTTNPDVSRALASRRTVLGDYLGSAQQGLRRASTSGSNFADSWTPFALGSDGTPNWWSPTKLHASNESKRVQIGQMFGFAAEDSQYRSEIAKMLKNIRDTHDPGNTTAVKDQVVTDINMSPSQFRTQFEQTARHLYNIADEDPAVRQYLESMGITTLDESDKSKFIRNLAEVALEGPQKLRRISSVIAGNHGVATVRKTVGVAPVRNQRNFKAGEAQKVVNQDPKALLFDPIERIIEESAKKINIGTDANGKPTTNINDVMSTFTDSIGKHVDKIFAKHFQEKNAPEIPEDLKLPSDPDSRFGTAKQAIIDYAWAKMKALQNPDDESLQQKARQAAIKAQTLDENIIVKPQNGQQKTDDRRSSGITDNAAFREGDSILDARHIDTSAPGESANEWDRLNYVQHQQLATRIGTHSLSIAGYEQSNRLATVQNELSRLKSLTRPTQAHKDKITLLEDEADTLKSILANGGEGPLVQARRELLTKIATVKRGNAAQVLSASGVVTESPAEKRQYLKKLERQLEQVDSRIKTSQNQIELNVAQIRKLRDPSTSWSDGGPMTEGDYNDKLQRSNPFAFANWNNLSPEAKRNYYERVQKEWREGKKPTTPIRVQDYGPTDVKFSGEEYDGSKHALAGGWSRTTTTVRVPDPKDSTKFVTKTVDAPGKEVPPLIDPTTGKINPNVKLKKTKDSDGQVHYWAEEVNNTGRVTARQEMFLESFPQLPDDATPKQQAEYEAALAKLGDKNLVAKLRDINTRRYQTREQMGLLNQTEATKVVPAVETFKKNINTVLNEFRPMVDKIEAIGNKLTALKQKDIKENPDAWQKHLDANKDLNPASDADLNTLMKKYKVVGKTNKSVAGRLNGLQQEETVRFERAVIAKNLVRNNDSRSSTTHIRNLIADPNNQEALGKLAKSLADNLRDIEYPKAVHLPEDKNFKWGKQTTPAIVAEIRRRYALLADEPRMLWEALGDKAFTRGKPHVGYTRGGVQEWGGLSFEEFDKRIGSKVTERNKELAKDYGHLANWINNSDYTLPDGKPVTVSKENPINDVYNLIHEHGPRYWNIFRDAAKSGIHIADVSKQHDVGFGVLSAEDRATYDQLRERDEKALDIHYKKEASARGTNVLSSNEDIAKRNERIRLQDEADLQKRLRAAGLPEAVISLRNLNPRTWRLGSANISEGTVDTDGFVSPKGRYIAYNSDEWKAVLRQARRLHKAGKPLNSDLKALIVEGVKSQSVPVAHIVKGKWVSSPGRSYVFIPPTKDDPGGLFHEKGSDLQRILKETPERLNGAYHVSAGGVRTALEVVDATSGKGSQLMRIPALKTLGISPNHPLAEYAGKLVPKDGHIWKILSTLASGKANIAEHVVTRPAQTRVETTDGPVRLPRLDEVDFDSLPISDIHKESLKKKAGTSVVRNSNAYKAFEKFFGNTEWWKTKITQPTTRAITDKEEKSKNKVTTFATGHHATSENVRVAGAMIDQAKPHDDSKEMKPGKKKPPLMGNKQVVTRNMLMSTLALIVTGAKNWWGGLTED